MNPTTTREYIRSTPLEVAAGWVYGSLPEVQWPTGTATPREALDDALRPALESPPCYVLFSGGRDSSAVLAAATALAQREGHAPPVPVTRVHPLVAETREDEWQQLVIGHLGLTEWVRLEYRHGETDLLGEPARSSLQRHGVLWPPALHTMAGTFSSLSPGSLLTGEGGDAVLGPHRVTPLTALRRGRRPSAPLLSLAAQSIAPGPVRRLLRRRAMVRSGERSWLTKDALHEHRRLGAADESAEPLAFDAALAHLAGRRFLRVVTHNQAVAAAEHGLRSSEPLLDAGFLSALARAGGRWGFTGRTAAMRALFSDVLPDAVLARATKASFNQAYIGEQTRAFARDWDGTGVDPDLVDVAHLRDSWLSEEPTMATGQLLHEAWLASERGPRP